MATFNWTHDYGAAMQQEPKTLRTDFGDGYTQETRVGINPAPRTWSVTFENRKYDEADAIVAFIRANHIGFDWTDPDGLPGRWTCRSWRSSHPNALVKTISASFEEIFGR